MNANYLLKGQIYILTDNRRNKRFELKFINISKRGYSFRNINAPFMYYFSEYQVVNNIIAK